MKKDLFLKRLYCAAMAALLIYSIVKYWQNMLEGRGLSSSIIISGIGLIAAGYYFFHPEKIQWKEVASSHRIGFAVFLMNIKDHYMIGITVNFSIGFQIVL